RQWANFVYTAEGSPARITVPAVAGEYVVKYFAREGRVPLAEAPVSVSLPEVSVTAPAEAVAGAVIEVEWTGPDYKDDYIGIGPVDAGGARQWANFVYTAEGSPARITVPAVAGEYVVKYFAREGRVPLAEAPVSVSLPEVSVTAPAEAVAGTTVEVVWTGPNYKDDYIGIGLADAGGARQWVNWVATSAGSPAELVIPAVAGDYVIKYFARQGRVPLAETPIAVTPPEASVSAPSIAVAGTTIEVDWIGPNYKDDYLGIGLVDAGGARQWVNWTRASDGTPAKLLTPPMPGDYVIKYFARQGRIPLAEAAISLTPIEAEIIAPATAEAGSTIEVGWSGPNYKDDYIGIGLLDAKGARQWQSYSRTSSGNPVTLKLPEDPGDYVLQYFVAQGRTPVAQVPLTLE
ncbi:MAG: hypothetical protein AAGB05_12870, partial [Pseudomonadota bacterium]